MYVTHLICPLQLAVHWEETYFTKHEVWPLTVFKKYIFSGMARLSIVSVFVRSVFLVFVA